MLRAKMREICTKITYCEYRRKIVQYYLEKYGALAKISVQCGSKERFTPFMSKNYSLEHIKKLVIEGVVHIVKNKNKM